MAGSWKRSAWNPNFSKGLLSRKTIIVAVEHVFMAEVLKKALESEYTVHLCRPNEVATEIKTLSPDITILEISLTQLGEIVSRPEMKHGSRTAKLVYLSTDETAQTAARAFRLGACAYVLKQAGLDEFRAALRGVGCGSRYLSAQIPRVDVNVLLNNRLSPVRNDSLTSRQLEILQLFTRGKTMKQIADLLDLSIATIAFHKYAMMRKLSLADTSALIRFGIRRCAA